MFAPFRELKRGITEHAAFCFFLFMHAVPQPVGFAHWLACAAATLYRQYQVPSAVVG